MKTLPNQKQENQREQRIDALLDALSVTDNSAEAAEKAKELYGLIVGEEGASPPRLDQLGRLMKEDSRLVDRELVETRQILLISTALGVLLNIYALYGLAKISATASQIAFSSSVAFCCVAYAVLLFITYKWGRYRGLRNEIRRSKQVFSSVVNRPEEVRPNVGSGETELE